MKGPLTKSPKWDDLLALAAFGLLQQVPKADEGASDTDVFQRSNAVQSNYYSDIN